MSRIRLLIADDTRLVRELLVGQLASEADFEVVGQASNGREAVDLATQKRPDVIIMDLNMPGLNGIKATERIVAAFPYIKVILLTGLDELSSLGKTVGATECMNKDCSPAELKETIRRVYHARRAEPARTSPATGHQIAIERLATRGGLSESEKTILERVVTTDLTIHQIATALSTERKKIISDSAVKHTLERVMTKLRLEPRTRSTLVKHVLEFNDNLAIQQEEEA